MINDGKERLLTTKEAANFLRIKAETLKNWRYLKKSPIPYIPISKRKVLYRQSDLYKFLTNKEVNNVN